MKFDVVDFFMRLCACPSKSGNEAAIYALLETELTKLGFQVSPCAAFGSGLPTPNLYASVEGRGEPLLFVAHMDTVWHDAPIEPYQSDGLIRAKGNEILGADDKSGIAAIISAAADAACINAPLEILFTVGEEAGFYGSRAADYSMIRSKRGYVFDSSADFGSVIVRSPQIRQYRYEIDGKAAHAAIHPGDGIHALLAATEIIHALDWGQVNLDSTTNVGNLFAQSATNVICEHASFEAEIRSFRREEAQRLAARFQSVAFDVCNAQGASLHVSELIHIPGFSISDHAPVLGPICDAFLRNGVTCKLASSYGGSDANILNENGIAAVNISTGMRDSHSPDESIRIEDLKMLTNIIKTMMAGGETGSSS